MQQIANIFLILLMTSTSFAALEIGILAKQEIDINKYTNAMFLSD